MRTIVHKLDFYVKSEDIFEQYKNRKMAVSGNRNSHQKDVQRMVRDTTSVRSGSIFLLQLFQGCSINDPTFFIQYRRIKRGHHVRAAAECTFV